MLAADLAIDHMRSYVGEWIADTLLSPHQLPTLRQHQDSIANDIIGMYGE